MDKELDVLIKGITSKYYTEYLKAIYKPCSESNENTKLPKVIKNSDVYKQIKDNLRKTYTNEESIINAQFGTTIIAEILSELLVEVVDKESK